MKEREEIGVILNTHIRVQCQLQPLTTLALGKAVVGVTNQFLIAALLRHLGQFIAHGKAAVIKAATELNPLIGTLYHSMQARVPYWNVIVLLIVVPSQFPVAVPNFKSWLAVRLVGFWRIEIYFFANSTQGIVNARPAAAKVHKHVAAVNF